MTETHDPRFSKWAVLALLASAQFIVVLDASIVNVALPSVQKDLGISQENLSWVVNAYVLTFGGFLLLGGRIADLLGRKAVFMGGLVLFAAASLVGGFAEHENVLYGARAVQGLGAALLSPAALSIVTVTFTEGAERNKALGVWGAVAGSGGAAGSLLGGVLTEGPGWEWVLWVNFPVGLLAAGLAWMMLRETKGERTSTFDVAGAATVTGGVSVLVYALVDAESAGWGSTQTLCLLAMSVGLLTAFVGFELRSDAPLVPFRIFRLRTLTGSNITGVLLGATLFAMFFVITLYMQQVLGFEPLEAGLAYMPLSVTIILCAGGASQLVTKIGFKPVLALGLAFLTAGQLWFSQVSAGGSFTSDVLGPSMLAAVGLGLSFVSVTIGAVHGVTERDSGLASGLINTSQQVGAALGVAILTAVASSQTSSYLSDQNLQGPPSEDVLKAGLNEGFQAAFLTNAAIGALALIVCLLAIRSKDSRETIGQTDVAVAV